MDLCLQMSRALEHQLVSDAKLPLQNLTKSTAFSLTYYALVTPQNPPAMCRLHDQLQLSVSHQVLKKQFCTDGNRLIIIALLASHAARQRFVFLAQVRVVHVGTVHSLQLPDTNPIASDSAVDPDALTEVRPEVVLPRYKTGHNNQSPCKPSCCRAFAWTSHYSSPCCNTYTYIYTVARYIQNSSAGPPSSGPPGPIRPVPWCGFAVRMPNCVST